MDAEIKQRWVDALRSGKYKQCRYRLSNGAEHCCLGVLADVAEIEYIKGWIGYDSLGYESIERMIGHDNSQLLWRMNDRDKSSFEEIADYIEANL